MLSALGYFNIYTVICIVTLIMRNDNEMQLWKSAWVVIMINDNDIAFLQETVNRVYPRNRICALHLLVVVLCRSIEPIHPRFSPPVCRKSFVKYHIIVSG